MSLKNLIILAAMILTSPIFGQLDVTYQQPPKEILDLADAPLPPLLRISPSGDYGFLLYRKQFKSITELSETEMRLAGLRINPATNISSRERYYFKLELLHIKTGKTVEVTGLPEEGKFSNFSWSPDEKKIALTHTTDSGLELWSIDYASGKATKLINGNLNANMEPAFEWFEDSEHILAKLVPEDKRPLIDETKAVPTGPIVSENDGQEAQNRTYQDLLKNKNDEFNFEQLTRSTLAKVGLNGKISVWKEADMYEDIDFSPDGKYIMLTTVSRPFSYIVPYYRFPSTTAIYDLNGNLVETIVETPLLEELPKGFMATQKGKRRISWRADKPSTIYWVEALDEGDPEVEVEYRDVLYQQDAPFKEEPRYLLKVKNRYAGMYWGNDNTAIALDRWWNNRNTKSYLFNPSNPDKDPEIIFDRNYQDQYNDPGSFVTERNQYGRSILALRDNWAYLIGRGYSEEGVRPFVDKMQLDSRETKRLYQADGKDQLEMVIYGMDVDKGIYLTRLESPTDYPNYYFRNIETGDVKPITSFENPFKAMQEVHKEILTYTRPDGVELSATLYLPPGYDRDKKEKLPMIMWAYPREYKDKSSAGQITTSALEFNYPYYGSPLYWVLRGYAILDDAAFPIIGEGEEEPNDSFIEQLVGNAKAAIDYVDSLGYIDREKVAVGGHSYGAFMTANLLSHSNLFAAGIARSGAYNRTLTPFGFQAEERNYWEAPEIYYQMSPFMHADKMKTPLLLIHGEADNNSGTYPMQSERYFNALKGLGATVRLVVLPKESHGYAARESILHLLWEQDRWLEKYVKNKEPKP
ncbi:MAG: prolyl oligopeptidase family serine peptidase [Saprospiraceae bacterium]